MPFLQKVVEYVSALDTSNDLKNAFKEAANAETKAEVVAAAGKFVAEAAIEVAVGMGSDQAN